MRVILIGLPGVGKGTQAALFEERFGAKPLASGDIFRHELKDETELGKLAKSYMERGELVPDEVTIKMMSKYLTAPDAKERGFILDGFPRSIAQAEALDALLEREGILVDRVVEIDVPLDKIVDRLAGRMGCPNCGEIYHRISKPPTVDGICDKCGTELTVRKDDQPETIGERLKVFAEKTKPVVAYYQRKGNFLRVDGMKPPQEVFATILAGLAVSTE